MLEKYQKNLIAHRGIYDNIIIPENSLKAFKQAIKYKLPIEFDIHLTKDNNLIVFHDYNLKRLTNSNLNIEKMTVEELKKLNILNTNEQLPTLEETLKLINKKVPIIIEIKANHNEQKLIKILLKQLSSYQGDVIIQTFNTKIIKLLKKKNSKYKVGLLISNKTDKVFFKILKISTLNINYCKPDFLSISKNIIKRKHIQKYLTKYPIYIWTIQKKEEILKINNPTYSYVCDNLPYK